MKGLDMDTLIIALQALTDRYFGGDDVVYLTLSLGSAGSLHRACASVRFTTDAALDAALDLHKVLAERREHEGQWWRESAIDIDGIEIGLFGPMHDIDPARMNATAAAWTQAG